MKRLAILTCALLVGACDGGTTEEADGGLDILLNGDAGTGASSGTDGGGQTGPKVLSVSAPLGIVLTDLPKMGEKAVDGTIMVNRGNDDVSDAVVTLNGTLIPVDSSGLYDVGDADLAPIAPGTPLVIEAHTTNPDQTATLTINCPSPVTITSPAADTVVSNPSTIGVQWSGSLTHEGSHAPFLGIRGCYIGNNQYTRWSYEGVELSLGQSSAQLTIDEDCRQHLLELRYVGEEVRNFHDGVLDMGSCYVQHRLWLQGVSK